MPEHLAPGVYVEETSFRPRSIEGVSTSTTALVGLTHSGPLAADQLPELLTSWSEFERAFGRPAETAGGVSGANCLAHAARAFFDEGGRRLYVARVGGTGADAAAWAAALTALSSLEDLSIVAAPGSTELGPTADAIQSLVIAHAEAVRGFAVLDVPQGRTPSQARDYRRRFDSKFAAFHYPWVRAANPSFHARNPAAPQELLLPPSGFICGIYARTDAERGVFKAPANEVILGALGFERVLTKSEQEMLNPEGVNCLRTFPGRGHRVWGARTASADPEWRYVNVRRYFNYLERSIDRGTQWAVFEPNGEALWANIVRAISDFLLGEWRNGALLGDKPEQAFFVRCDRSTMTQNDLDHGRLICLVGVAMLKPAEFVIFRIGQQTADAR